jgi:hypothetical protein
MNARINASTTQNEISAILASALALGATHCRVLKSGGQRASVIQIDALIGTYLGEEAEVFFGTKQSGLPFEPLEEGATPAPVPPVASPMPTSATEDTLAPATSPDAPVGKATRRSKHVSPPPEKLKKPFAQVGTGFIAAIDKLLLNTTPEPVEGFKRSKYSVDDALRAIMKLYPAKDPVSVKKIIKVRPRHLEKAKHDGAFDNDKNRAPRWAFVGPGAGTGAQRRIDELILGGERDTNKIANIVAHEFGRAKDKTAKLATERFSKLARKVDKPELMKGKPLPKPGQRKRDLIKAKNLELLAKRKAAKAKKSKKA